MTTASIISLVVSGFMFLISITTFILNRVDGIRKNSAALTQMLDKLESLQKTTDTIKDDVKEMSKELRTHSEDIAVLKRDLNTAFKKIDELRDDIRRLQKGGH